MDEKCDFCGRQVHPAGGTVFDCNDFEVTAPDGDFTAMSRGGWIACGTCTYHVKHHLIHTLANQIMRREVQHGLHRGEALKRRDFRIHIWTQFEANRTPAPETQSTADE